MINISQDCNTELSNLLRKNIQDQMMCINCEIYAYKRYYNKVEKPVLMDQKSSFSIKDIILSILSVVSFFASN